MSRRSDAEGYLLLRKRPGLTSFDALGVVKRALGTSRVGHTGTLDKFAEGLLVVLVGRMTRLVPWFTASDKEYVATVAFGTETDTLDPEGAIVAEAAPPDEPSFLAALPAFRGPIMQTPPLYSSVHIAGKRAHELARAGIDAVPQARPVVIHELEVLGFDGANAELRIACSKGTYIRSLARDIALACGSRAHLTALKRTRVGSFLLDDATDPFESQPPAIGREPPLWDDAAQELVRSALRPVDAAALALAGIAVAEVSPAASRGIAFGKPVDPSWLGGSSSERTLALVDGAGRFLALTEWDGARRRYAFVAAAAGTPGVGEGE